MASHYFREWRKARGFTLEQMATSTGLSPATIARIEKGDYHYNQRHLEAFASALGVEPYQILQGPPPLN